MIDIYIYELTTGKINIVSADHTVTRWEQHPSLTHPHSVRRTIELFIFLFYTQVPNGQQI